MARPGHMIGGPPPRGGMPRSGHPGMGPKRVEEEFDITKLEAQSEEMMKMIFLEKDACKFYEVDSGFLNLTVGDVDYKHVQVIRTFPYTAPFEYLSVREDGNIQKEIGIIKDLNVFDTKTIELVKRQLEYRYFTPVIKKIIQVKRAAGMCSMRVETDYGECRFSFRTNNNAVTKLAGNRIFIQDTAENRYEIPDTTKLSMREQKKLDVLL